MSTKKNRSPEREGLPSLFGHLLATPASVGGEAPVFCAPAEEGCGPNHAKVGEVGGHAVCVLSEFAESFERPVANLVKTAEAVIADNAREAEAHAAFLRGIIRKTADGIREDRAVPPSAEAAPEAATDENDLFAGALWLQYLVTTHEMDLRAAVVVVRTRGAEMAALGFQRRDEFEIHPKD